MLQQIYRRPPCRRAISIKLCSNIIETYSSSSLWLSPVDLLTDFSSFYAEQLGEAAFCDSYLLTSTQAQFFLCICTENKIQLQMSSKHNYSHKQ